MRARHAVGSAARDQIVRSAPRGPYLENPVNHVNHVDSQWSIPRRAAVFAGFGGANVNIACGVVHDGLVAAEPAGFERI